jgi:hypothetical protein
VTASGRKPKPAVPRARGSLSAALCLSAVLILGASGCFNAPAPTNTGGFKSFLGIAFGTSLKDTRQYYPQGLTEASPLGFPAYHVRNLSSESILYTDVIYEFDGIKGMQVVFARFAPASSDAVLERLRRVLGEPTQHTLTTDQRMEEALWLTPGGEEIRFYRAHHLLTVIGPEGAKLRKDVELRLENSSIMY